MAPTVSSTASSAFRSASASSGSILFFAAKSSSSSWHFFKWSKSFFFWSCNVLESSLVSRHDGLGTLPAAIAFSSPSSSSSRSARSWATSCKRWSSFTIFEKPDGIGRFTRAASCFSRSSVPSRSQSKAPDACWRWFTSRVLPRISSRIFLIAFFKIDSSAGTVGGKGVGSAARGLNQQSRCTFLTPFVTGTKKSRQCFSP
mmetsp:Transcript_147801/g.368297  ORF Transcript_147801/g.368297 Transcript_147801/m.368297 type:complete len:201 (-) Transcript_147801:273-875(-)